MGLNTSAHLNLCGGSPRGQTTQEVPPEGALGIESSMQSVDAQEEDTRLGAEDGMQAQPDDEKDEKKNGYGTKNGYVNYTNQYLLNHPDYVEDVPESPSEVAPVGCEIKWANIKDHEEGWFVEEATDANNFKLVAMDDLAVNLKPLELVRRNSMKYQKSNVMVYVRWRPMTEYEHELGDVELTRTCRRAGEQGEGKGYIARVDGFWKGLDRKWENGAFTGVFDACHDNATTYDRVVSPMLPRVMNGGTAAVFCYGHTGSGKTHTVLGYGQEYGLFYRAAEEVFAQIRESGIEGLSIAVRFAEMHDNKVYDLMRGRELMTMRESENGVVNIRTVQDKSKKKEEQKNFECRIEGLRQFIAKDAHSILGAITNGMSLRQVGSSNLHSQSSRSHAWVEFEIVNQEYLDAHESLIVAESKAIGVGPSAIGRFMRQVRESQAAINQLVGDGAACLGGKLVFVDLAGAEAGNMHAGQKQSVEDYRSRAMINKSLMTLKEVIIAQSKGLRRIPFRDSKLTMVLRNYLLTVGCESSMIANLSPSQMHASKAIQTLQYALLVAGGKSIVKAEEKMSRFKRWRMEQKKKAAAESKALAEMEETEEMPVVDDLKPTPVVVTN